ncbi:unnamed protein product [Rhodiola kirilowii]
MRSIDIKLSWHTFRRIDTNYGILEVEGRKQNRPDYLKWKAENRIMLDGVNAKLLGCHGPLANRQPGRAFLDAVA